MALPLAYPATRDWLGRLPPAYTADTGATLFQDLVGAKWLPSDWTFTRANATATRVNSSGQIVMCAANEPRFDYHPTTRVPLGLLIEGARTNLLVNSVLAGGTTPTSWTLAGTGTPAVASSIYGNSDGAVAITFTVAASQQYLTQTVAGVASTTYSASARVEATSGLSISQLLHAVNGTATVTIASYVVNGVVGTSASVPVAGDRIHITYTLSGTGNCVIRYGAGTTSNSTGTATLSRVQDEVGTFPSSYIPTTTASVARAADVCTITGSAAAAIINTAVGTLFCEFDFAGGDSSLGSDTRIAFSLDNGTTSHRHVIYNTSGGVGNLGLNTSSIYNMVPSPNPTIAVGTIKRVTTSYDTNRFVLAVDGVSPAADTAGTPSSLIDRVQVGGSVGAGQLYGHIRRVAIWQTALSDTVLAAVTSSTTTREADLVAGLFPTTAGVLPPA